VPSEDVIIRRVRRDGTVDVLGRWLPAARTLEIERMGFPLAGIGAHPVEGEPPWVFDEMAPDGFLAERFAAWFPELSLPRVRTDWAIYGEVAGAAGVVRSLVNDRVLNDEDAARFARVDAFSRAIGNTDAHLGNYGLLIDDDGQAVLSPAYDVVPMAFAPRHDELPDRYVTHAPAAPSDVQPSVQRYISTVSADDEISQDFKQKWLATVT
jgi:hypothetical protein